MPRFNWNDWRACQLCMNEGWGPMLTTELWRKIEPGPLHPSQPSCRIFLCEDCMEHKLGRKITGGDLRDCPMNYSHRAYLPNGAM